MTNDIRTERLFITRLQPEHAAFIKELLNTEGWLTFIGNRNINSMEDAKTYIEKITRATSINYYVVHENATEAAGGVVTFIKRDYLLHHDIGFAFLPSYNGKGYAFEAATALVKYVAKEKECTNLLAIVLPQNISSIKLLGKLGFVYQKQIEVDGEMLHMFNWYALPK
jgi:[ribosomal protein S5]-alanine N-acetyltransferase